MKEEISQYYRDKGFDVVYININKEPRRVATLRNSKTKEMRSMSYAKYLFTSFHCCDINQGDEIDHINNDKMDDRIENLQVISKGNNIRKSHVNKKMIERECPICHKTFQFPLSNLKSHPNPCCSRKCGGIKSHLKKDKIV
ncbi:MAG: HNH endonuclease [bacterium]|nr:HNH endonuclease [bacterium]